MKIKKYIGVVVVATVALLTIALLFFVLITEPLKFSSYNSWFSIWFDVNARYKVSEDSVDIFVISVTMKHAEGKKYKYKGRISTDTVVFGLAADTNKKWSITEKSNKLIVNSTTMPGNTIKMYFRRFSIPINSFVNLKERWIVLASTNRYIDDIGNEKTIGSVYAHSDKDIFKSAQQNDLSTITDDGMSVPAMDSRNVTNSARASLQAVTVNSVDVFGLRFGIFHLGLDPRQLVLRYPMSSHRVTMATPGRGWSHIPGFGKHAPDAAALWEAYTTGAGTYILRVAPDEVTDGIYYVQFKFNHGRIMRMWLRFEVPVALRGEIDGRSCASVMESLVETYGPPTRELPPYPEEAAMHEPKLWLGSQSELRWDCAEYAVILRRVTPDEKTVSD